MSLHVVKGIFYKRVYDTELQAEVELQKINILEPLPKFGEVWKMPVEQYDLTKTIDEMDLEAKLHQMFPKQKKMEETDKQYEHKFMKGFWNEEKWTMTTLKEYRKIVFDAWEEIEPNIQLLWADSKKSLISYKEDFEKAIRYKKKVKWCS
jgi:hypothetical protein